MRSARQPMEMDLAVCLWTLGLLTAAEMSEAAAAALEHRKDSVILQALARTPLRDPGSLEDLWLRALDELQLKQPEPPQAILRVSQHYAARVLAGEMEPYHCAKLLWQLQLSVMQFPEDLLRFIGHASAWDDAPTPEKRAAVERKIRDECAALVSRSSLVPEADSE